jgi:hypothetical protein
MKFLAQHSFLPESENKKKTIQILNHLYNDIVEAYDYSKNSQSLSFSVKKVETSVEVVKPKNFNASSFPEKVRKHIDEMSIFEISCTFSLMGRIVKVIFIEEDVNVEMKIKQYERYLERIVMWLYILDLYSSKKCAETLVIYLYFTSLEKELPSSNIEILEQNHVNTAFTYSCTKDSEIVLFRKEEWFKVFIHETFHTFGLDFSDMNNESCHSHVLSLFKVKSMVNAYEAYTEFWAEIMNSLFCSFFTIQDKTDIPEFIYYAETYIQYERNYSFFQMVKILNFMGLTYKDLYVENEHSKTLRETLFKEKTSVLSYYVIKTVLLGNFQDFLSWCSKNNLSLISFKKTIANQRHFCEFLEKHYRSSAFLKMVGLAEDIWKKKGSKKNGFLSKNLRMSVCEIV